MNSKYKILAFGPNPWDGAWMNRQQILSRLGKDADVIYVSPLMTHWELKSIDWQRRPWRGIFRRMDNVWVDSPPKWLFRVPSVGALNAIATFLHFIRLKRHLKRLRGDRILVYAFRPEYIDYVRRLKPAKLIYHVYDVFDLEATWDQRSQRQQSEMMNLANVVVASSKPMAERLKKVSGYTGHIEVITNGVDSDTFFLGPCTVEPEDIRDISAPRLAYVGRLNSKVDFKLLATLAGKNPDWNFILVGPEVFYDAEAKRHVDECKSLQNIFFLGGKGRRELPAYMAAMDVNMLCYVLDSNSWSYYGFPLKLHEYLACGKPVVSARLGSVEEFSEVVAIAGSPEDWQLKIEMALRGEGAGSPISRQRVALANSWDKKVEAIKDLFDHGLD